MKNLLGAVLMLLTLGGCALNGIGGNGNVKEQKRQLLGFESINASGSFDITVKQGEEFSVKIRADENLHPVIETRVENGTLYISSTKNIIRAEANEIYIVAPNFSSFDFSGAIELVSAGMLKGETLELECSGAAEIELALEYDEMNSQFSGACEVNLSGEVGEVTLNASGASELEWTNLEIEDLKLNSSGACEAELYVKDRLSIDASGASEIKYRGQPKIVKSDLSGAASLESIN